MILYFQQIQYISIFYPIILREENIFAIINGPNLTLPDQLSAFQNIFPH